jgi:hypothetical protein
MLSRVALVRTDVSEELSAVVVAERSIDQGHRNEFHNSSILASKTRYMDRIVGEAIEIELHPSVSVNRLSLL